MSDNELEPLERPISGSGGMQSLLRSLKRLRDGRVQNLTPELAAIVARRAFWTQGGFQGRLQPLAQRLLADGKVMAPAIPPTGGSGLRITRRSGV